MYFSTELLPSMWEAQGSVPSTKDRETAKGRDGRREDGGRTGEGRKTSLFLLEMEWVKFLYLLILFLKY